MIDYHTYNSKKSSRTYAPTPFNMKDFLSVAVAADTSNTPIVDVSAGFFIGVQSAFGLFSEDFFDIKNQGDTIQVYVRPNLDPDYKDLIFTLDTQTLCEYTR